MSATEATPTGNRIDWRWTANLLRFENLIPATMVLEP
jgi:hypothetical protein